MSTARSETLVLSATDRAGNLAQATIPINWLSTAAPAFPGAPPLGHILWGQTRQGGVSAMTARLAQYAQILGRQVMPGVIRIYIQPFTTLADGVKKAQAAVADAITVTGWGALPFIDCKELAGKTMADVGAGAMDQVIDALMEGLVAHGIVAIVGYHQEPVGDTVGGKLANPVDYAAAVGRFGLRAALAGGQRLITIVGCIGFGAFTSATTGQFGSALPWFQQLAPVSPVWGWHKYLQYESQDEAKWLKGWSFDDLFGQFFDLQDSVDSTKVRVGGETGVHTRAADLTTAPLYMDQLMDYLIAARVVGLCWFDSGTSVNAGGSWAFDCPVQGAPNQSPETSRLVTFAQQQLDSRVGYPQSTLALAA